MNLQLALGVVLLLACGPSAAVEPDTPEPDAPETGDAPPPAPEIPAAPEGQIDLGRLGDDTYSERSITAFVPAGPGPWPVLFVLDGHAESTLRVRRAMGRLLHRDAVSPWVVVLVPSGQDRRRELGIEAEAMGDFLIETVLVALSSQVSIRVEPEARAVLGYSYGGLAALRTVIHRDELGRAAAMSPSLWWQQRRLTREWNPERAPSRLWIDVGTAEPDRNQTLPYMVRDARELRDRAVEGGMRFGDELGYYEAPGEGHNFNAAGRRMETALAFLLSDVDLAERRPDAVSMFLLPTTARWQSFAIEARYGELLRLTWPPDAAELEVVGEPRPRRGDLIHTVGESRLTATLRGVRSDG
ncbi:MAG: alpha/beta hydrolase [Sandaracinaceae bacterium]